MLILRLITKHGLPKQSIGSSKGFQHGFNRINPQFVRFQSSKPKTKNFGGEMMKLFRLARPEMKVLLGALGCLVVTSSVGMTLPLIVGKIIDSSNSELDREKNGEDKQEKSYFGLNPQQFYGGAAVMFTVAALSNFGRIYLLKLAGEKLVARIRARLFSKILSQDSYFFDVGPTGNGMKVGDLISRLSSDTQLIAKTLSGNISDGARSLISGLVGLSMMYYVSWQLSLAMSLFFPPLILMSTVYGSRIKNLSKKVQENLGSLTKASEEKLNGLKTIQSFARQPLVIHDYNKEIRQLFNTSMVEGKLSAGYFSVNSFLGNSMIIGLLYVGTTLISSGNLTVGDLSSFMMYAAFTGSSIFGLGNFYTELMKGIGAAERVFELTESKSTINTTIGKKVDDLHGDVELKNVTFHYPSRPNINVFESLNLQIKRGQNVCIVGPSGSGKSTISQILLRFYDPSQGEVLVNKNNIKDLSLNFYRKKIGYVQQEPLLFSGTIRENITFGKDNCTEEEIKRACDLSNCTGFIDSFPDGLDTFVGPSSSGAQLSGGQKQRISLARTLIKQPNILILDEATSALDSISEEIVMRNLTKLSRENSITIISIAHRLSTIRNSERIVVLSEHGQVVEDGTFGDLYYDKTSEFNKLLKKSGVQATAPESAPATESAPEPAST